MEENIIRIKYRYLQSNLYSIKNMISDVGVVMEDLKSDMREGLIIDDKYVEEDSFETIINTQKDIYLELSTQIIPTVSNRC